MTRLRTSGCCDCDNSCQLECRSKSGFASLCGFPEFTDPSTPPKLYKQKTITGQVLVCEFVGSECAQPACEDVGTPMYENSGVSVIDGETIAWEGTAQPLYYDQGSERWIYIETASAIMQNDGTDRALRTSAIGAITLSDTTFSVGPCAVTDAFVSIFLGTDRTVTDSVQGMVTPPPETSKGGRRDKWDVTAVYTPGAEGACALDRDLGTSRSDLLVAGACNSAVEGTDAGNSLFVDDPSSLYGDDMVASETATERTWVSAGCLPAAPGEVRQVGSIAGADLVESLSDEDTPDAAIARAMEGAEWSGGECHLHTAFATGAAGEDYAFTYRFAQTRARCGTLEPLIVGHDYQVTIAFYRRALASDGPYVFFGVQEVGFNATDVIDYTPWIDVPNEASYETIARGCQIEDVTQG